MIGVLIARSALVAHMRRLIFLFLALGFLSTTVAQSPRPHVVMLIAENEYETDKSLPAFAKSHLSSDYRLTTVFADPKDSNRLVGIESLDSADVLVISVRRRTLPNEQLDVVRRYVAESNPVVGIRTASHAFSLRGKDPPKGRAEWPEFDKVVFGGNYTNHYGNSLRTTVHVHSDVPAHASELLSQIDSSKPFVAGGSLYKVSPLADGTSVLLNGSVEGQPSEPIAWTYIRKDGGKSFYTSLGHIDDFRGDVLPRLLVNAINWSLGE